MVCFLWCILGKSSGWALVGTRSIQSFPGEQGQGRKRGDSETVRGGLITALQPFNGQGQGLRLDVHVLPS